MRDAFACLYERRVPQSYVIMPNTTLKGRAKHCVFHTAFAGRYHHLFCYVQLLAPNNSFPVYTKSRAEASMSQFTVPLKMDSIAEGSQFFIYT